jgi:hypothetical protein
VSLKTELTNLDVELAAAEPRVRDVLVAYFAYYAASVEILAREVPPEMWEKFSEAGWEAIYFLGKKLMLGKSREEAFEKLQKELREHSPTLMEQAEQAMERLRGLASRGEGNPLVRALLDGEEQTKRLPEDK